MITLGTGGIRHVRREYTTAPGEPGGEATDREHRQGHLTVTRLPLITTVLLAATLSVPAAPLGAQQTLALQNGDRLTGVLKQIDGASWVFAYGG